MSALGALSEDASTAGVLAGPLGDLTKVLGPQVGYSPLGWLGEMVFASGPIVTRFPAARVHGRRSG